MCAGQTYVKLAHEPKVSLCVPRDWELENETTQKESEREIERDGGEERCDDGQ